MENVDLKLDPLALGIQAFGRDSMAEARAYFRKAIHADMRNGDAWLWMAEIAETVYERQYYLRRALEIDPDNAAALARLESLAGSVESEPI